MRSRSRASVVVAFVVCLAAPPVHAESYDWPVKLNVTFPLGYTFGCEQVRGFTWGFRGQAAAYPGSSGLQVGGYLEMLLGNRVRSMASYGVVASAPVQRFDDHIDLRLGGYAGVRSFTGEDRRRLATGLVTDVALPAYAYEFRVGLRFDATFDGVRVSASSVLIDLDLAALLGLLVWASVAK